MDYCGIITSKEKLHRYSDVKTTLSTLIRALTEYSAFVRFEDNIAVGAQNFKEDTQKSSCLLFQFVDFCSLK